jgi:hypothetical protein
MNIAVVTNHREGKGLARDAAVLRPLLERMGHRVINVQWDDPPPPHKFDLGISLEVVVPAMLDRCDRSWLIPNPEWFRPTFRPHLERFHRVLCKTHDALRIFSKLTPATQFVGWASEDRYDPTVEREHAVFYNPGGSTARHHDAVFQAWRKIGPALPLTVVSSVVPDVSLPGVRMHRKLDEVSMRREQNRHLYHLCPSHYEGWGHYLHEALGVGALIATTDAAPMNEVAGIATTIPTAGAGEQMLARTAKVDAAGIVHAVNKLIGLKSPWGTAARASFVRERDAFELAVGQLLENP